MTSDFAEICSHSIWKSVQLQPNNCDVSTEWRGVPCLARYLYRPYGISVQYQNGAIESYDTEPIQCCCVSWTFKR